MILSQASSKKRKKGSTFIIGNIKGVFVKFIYAIAFFLLATDIQANLYSIPFPAKEKVTDEDYIHIQNQLRTIDIIPTLIQLDDEHYSFPFAKFWGRCASGIYLGLIEPEKGHFPIQRLEKIGNGGERCIVSYASYNRKYHELIKSIPEALEKAGFNGYFLYRIGGYPNPTGREIQYVGVPYAFKIFMILEAHQLGFNHILWIDASMLPLRDPSPLLDWIDRHEIFYYGWKTSPHVRTWLYPATFQILKDVTGVDIFDARYVCGAVFGLKMNTEKAKQFIDLYYRCVDLATPFLSYNPEEFVWTAILGKVAPELEPFPPEQVYNRRADALEEGFYFDYRPH
jgi:hypothetical protein